MLKIKGKTYSWANLHELPQNLSPHVVSSSQDARHYGFFSELNSLSNFHPTPFKHEGKEYINSKQFIWAKKAEFSGDTEILKEIMCAKTALECKNLGKEVKNCKIDNWNAEPKNGVFPAFYQNSDRMQD